MASDGYLPTQGRARWAVRLILMEVVLGLLSCGLQIACVMAWHQEPGGAEQKAIQEAQASVWYFSHLVCLVSSAAFLMWQYRFICNMPGLAALGTRFSPGWAVAYWFIPIVGLFRPYQVLQEMWRCSAPEGDLTRPDSWRRERRGGLIVAYWAANISDEVLFWSTLYVAARSELLGEGLFGSPPWYFVSWPALRLVGCGERVLFLCMVERLEWRISARHERWLAVAGCPPASEGQPG